MSPQHMILDYGRAWISAHVGVCMPMRLCAAVHAHTCALCMPLCMIAFKHAFAAQREERSTPEGIECVCVYE